MRCGLIVTWQQASSFSEARGVGRSSTATLTAAIARWSRHILAALVYFLHFHQSEIIVAKNIDDVEGFLATLEHPHKPALLAIREVILSTPGVVEGIKWNSPSFRTTEWFATFHLRAKAGVMVILHLGAKVRVGDSIAIDDPTGLLTWLGKDRASVVFADEADVAAKRKAFAALIRRWVEYV